MALPPEDAAREALWFAQRAARIAKRAEIESALSGDPVAAAAVHAGFRPLVDAELRRQMPEEEDVGDSPIVVNQNVDF